MSDKYDSDATTSWEAYWAPVENETYLLARDLIMLSVPIRRHFERHIHASPSAGGVDLDWSAAAREADDWPCSSTERVLLDLILGVVQPDERHNTCVRRDPDTGETYTEWVVEGTRTIDPRSLARLNEWAHPVAARLHQWMTDQA